jgi:4,5:9,10-diseco-3-hydroxy-5,9,17-trioxoandrosta-1(10),2-diene-4-oate hydrolase
MGQSDHFVDVEGLRTRYWDEGAGEVLLLVHGITSSVHFWQENVEALSANHRVIVLDLPGCGLTDKPDEFDYSLKNLSRFLLGFMDAIKVERAHVAGNSLGGRLALGLAHIAPDRVGKLILADPAAIGPETIINFRLASLRGLGELLTRPSRFGFNGLMKAALFDVGRTPAGFVDQLVDYGKMPGNHRAFLKTLRHMVRLSGFHPKVIKDVQSWLPDVSASTLVIWGREDKILPMKHAKILTETMPDARAVIYDDCGHLPQLEWPQKFNADVLEFLAPS